MLRQRHLTATFSLTATLLAAGVAHAGVSYATPGGTYAQNFDTLSSTGASNAWTNNSTLPGWYIFSSQATSGDSGRRTSVPDDVAPAEWVAVDTYEADDAPRTRSRVYSLGQNGSSERALGAYTTASGNPFVNQINPGDNLYALALQNTSGATLTDPTVTYAGEQWLGHFNPDNTGTLEFSYLVKSGFNAQLDIPTQNTNAPFTRVEPLDFVGNALFPPEEPLDGNAAANREVLTHTLTGVTWEDGDYLILRWLDNDVSGEDLGLAIDDVSFSANAIPEPTSIAVMLGLSGLVLRRRRHA